MNLLEDPWLPFRHRDGTIAYRSPESIAEPSVLDVAFPRADFQGAAYQWLIGLLQTAFAAADEHDWMQRFATPPTSAELNAVFDPFSAAFELDGDGPRFMQDSDPLDSVAPGPISALLVDSPGDNGIKNNTDFFVKRGLAEVLCCDCAAIAIFTLETNGPSLGSGHRVGLRGGGPLTSLVVPEKSDATIWRRLWLNILLPNQLKQRGQTGSTPSPTNPNIFPWMGPTRTSERDDSEIFPAEVDPLHVYWAMPHRFRLLFDSAPCTCSICGRYAERSVTQLKRKKHGARYGGPWLHPLTPYSIDPKKPANPPISKKGQPNGIDYRHWPQYVFSPSENSVVRPAGVVHFYVSGKVGAAREARDWGDDVEALYLNCRLLVFGYDLDKGKTRGWYSAEMPIMTMPAHQLQHLRKWSLLFVDLASGAAWMLRKQVTAAWFSRPSEAKGDLAAIELQFFGATEGEFYRALRDLQASFIDTPDLNDLPSDIASRWYQHVRRSALRQFETQALSGPVEETAIRRVIMARRNLLYWLNHNKTVKAFADEGGFELRSSDPQTTNEQVSA